MEIGGICIACSANCDSCNPNGCLECLDGFYRHDNGSCVPCSNNCDKCLDQEVCQECNSGFVLELASEVDDVKLFDTQCIACDSSCLTCTEKVTFCLSCPGDRRLKDGKCQTRLTIRFRFTLDFDFVSFLEN